MAVYTHVSDADAAIFVAGYEIGTFQKLIGIKSGVSNSNYFIDTSAGRNILTLYEKRTAEEDLPFFLGLMDHLAAQGVPCPTPLRMKNGDVLGHLSGRPAAITSFLPGTPLMRVTPDECAETGRALARLHLAGASFPMRRANTLALSGWEQLLISCRGRADQVRAGLETIVTDEIAYLKEHWPKDLPRGIIHADFFPNNVFFDQSTLCGVIDFYFACEDFFAYDLAIVLNAWCFEPGVSFNITKARALTSGYNEIRRLMADEIRLLPVLARGASMRFLATRLYDWLHQDPGALMKPLDPMDYVARLQFHQRAADAAAYGIAA